MINPMCDLGISCFVGISYEIGSISKKLKFATLLLLRYYIVYSNIFFDEN